MAGGPTLRKPAGRASAKPLNHSADDSGSRPEPRPTRSAFGGFEAHKPARFGLAFFFGVPPGGSGGYSGNVLATRHVGASTDDRLRPPVASARAMHPQSTGGCFPIGRAQRVRRPASPSPRCDLSVWRLHGQVVRPTTGCDHDPTRARPHRARTSKLAPNAAYSWACAAPWPVRPTCYLRLTNRKKHHGSPEQRRRSPAPLGTANDGTALSNRRG